MAIPNPSFDYDSTFRYDDQIIQVSEVVRYQEQMIFTSDDFKQEVMHRALNSIQELVNKTSKPHEVLMKDIDVTEHASATYFDLERQYTFRYDTRHGRSRKYKTYVICASHNEFNFYVRNKLDEIWRHNILADASMSDYVYVSDPDILRGQRTVRGVLYGNWRARKDIRYLLEVLISRIDNEQSRQKLHGIYRSLNT